MMIDLMQSRVVDTRDAEPGLPTDLRVTNTREGAVYGPRVGTGKASKVGGTRRIFEPGDNRVPLSYFERLGLQQREAIYKLRNSGTLRISVWEEPSKSPEEFAAAPGPTAAPEFPTDAAEAIEAISQCSDPAKLDRWFSSDSRAAVSDAILSRLTELDGMRPELLDSLQKSAQAAE